jgi:5-methylcytosine-specific restriction endonuclease McrA
MKYKFKSQSFSRISDDELLHRLSEILQRSRRVEAELVAHIGEADRRRLYVSRVSSMFRYATEILNLSEHEAYLRIEVARASRKHPVLLEMLADGRLHLSGIALLHKHLTEDNREKVLERAVNKSKRQIEELMAELAPKPDIQATMRKRPERQSKAQKTRDQLGPDLVRPPSPEQGSAVPGEKAEGYPSAADRKPPVVKPIAPARYQVQFTAGAELRDKLERLQALMRSSGGDGDLAAVIDAAVTEKLERLEAKRFGRTKSPRKSLEETDTSPSSRYIPAAVKRAVCERDQYQCTYQDDTGRRCTETKHLEFHHLKPYGRGGSHDPSNIRLVCKSHNLHLAERDYGKEVMERHRNSPNRVSEPAAVYTYGNRTTRVVRPA